MKRLVIGSLIVMAAFFTACSGPANPRPIAPEPTERTSTPVPCMHINVEKPPEYTEVVNSTLAILDDSGATHSLVTTYTDGVGKVIIDGQSETMCPGAEKTINLGKITKYLYLDYSGVFWTEPSPHTTVN